MALEQANLRAFLLLIVAFQTVTFALTRTVYWTDGWLYVNLLFAVAPMVTCRFEKI